MSATKLLVLGVVHLSGGAHGYQVRSELQSWRAEIWAKIKPGSIYHALKKAAADGLLTEQVEPGSSGPERVLYRLTARGRDEMVELVRDGLRRTHDPDMLNASIAMLPMLTRTDAIAHINERVARLEVEDTGPGIPPEAQQTIFEPFVRVSPAKAAGTGLGLATVKRLVEAHGGRLGVQSKPDAGSLFWVELPLVSGDPAGRTH